MKVVVYVAVLFTLLGWFSCGPRTAEVGLKETFVVPQWSSSECAYVADEQKQFYFLENGHKEVMPGLSFESTHFFKQFDRSLIVFSPLGFSGYTEYAGTKLVKEVKLNESSTAYFLQIWEGELFSGWFEKDQLYFDHYDAKGVKQQSDLVQLKRKYNLYTSGQLYSAVCDGRLWVWSPAHDALLLYDQKLQNQEVIPLLRPKEFAEYDENSLGEFFDIQDSQGTPGLWTYSRQNVGKVLKVAPERLVLIQNEVCMIYNITRMSDEENPDGTPKLKKEGYVIQLDGRVLYKRDDVDIMGLAGQSLLVKERNYMRAVPL